MSGTAPHVKIPTYCHWKTRGVGYVRLDGRRKVLPGPYGSPESRAAYKTAIASWCGGEPSLAPSTSVITPPTPASAPTTPAVGLTVGEFILAYMKYAGVRYAKHGHHYAIRGAFAPMLKLFRRLPLVEFGPKRLKEAREALVERGLIRREINRRMQWIRNGIRWAVAEELIPGEVLHRLNAVEILRRDEAAVRESQPVRPVDEVLVMRTIEHVSPEVAAMVRLQLLTGARSGEVAQMNGAALDMTAKDGVWLFRPAKHKTQNLGHDRVIPMGKRAQEIIRPFLIGDPTAFIFSPARAEQRRREALHAARKTPARVGNNVGTKIAQTDRQVGDCYDAATYGKAILRGIEQAFPLPAHLAKMTITPQGRKKQPRPETQAEWSARLSPAERAEVKAWRKKHHWHPHQLRHSAATAVREQFGLDAAQAIMGHANLSATQIYAELQTAKAIDVARKVG